MPKVKSLQDRSDLNERHLRAAMGAALNLYDHKEATPELQQKVVGQIGALLAAYHFAGIALMNYDYLRINNIYKARKEARALGNLSNFELHKEEDTIK